MNSKKYDVGIISFNINTLNSNFGAALHSFAFQKYLSKIGVSSIIINYKQNKNFFNKRVKRELFRHFPLSLFLFIFRTIKQKKFNNFYKKYCIATEKTYYPDTICELANIDRYCCETDVTWHTFGGVYDRAFMCDYPNMKACNSAGNIAYSVDFESCELSEQNKIQIKKYAENFKYISFRNIFKLDYIKKIIEREDACIMLDPTLLLYESDYIPYIKYPSLTNYVLVLNCKENNPEMVLSAKEFAKENNLKLKVINFYDKNNKKYFDGIPTPIGIEEYLGYIYNANYIFTNSYHGICFCIIFKKNFFAYSRNTNNEKILSVTGLFDLTGRYVQTGTLPKDNIDYTKVDIKLEALRKNARSYLYDALK